MRITISLTSLFLILLFAACGNRDPKYAQYLVQGERLYAQHCSNCHQADGKGFGSLYPPLAGSDFLAGRKSEVICLIRNGIDSALVVNGIVYDQPMPGNEKLTDLEIAEIVTYVYGKWGGDKLITEIAEVSRATRDCDLN
ncbi:MAG: c-type cytochrome [Cyclobacteriaceae bacterium]